MGVVGLVGWGWGGTAGKEEEADFHKLSCFQVTGPGPAAAGIGVLS